jgi:multidrug efflux pump subunit AcrA (membrane-fusion protein)
MRCSAILPAGLMGLVLLTACGGGQDSSAPPPTPSSATVVAPASTTAAPTTAAPTTAASPTVPAILDFEADLIGGGTFRGADLAGGDTLFWFWAPT